jgi:hypothetical protein
VGNRKGGVIERAIAARDVPHLASMGPIAIGAGGGALRNGCKAIRQLCIFTNYYKYRERYSGLASALWPLIFNAIRMR